MPSLTQEQIEFFHQNGYLRIGKILEEEHIELLRREYDHEFDTARQNNRFRILAISNTDDLDEKNNAPAQMLQDNGYWKCAPASLVSCWLTLDDVTAENGAMHVIPGSHLRPLSHERSSQTDALLDIEDRVDISKSEIIDLPAGGVMFHHCQTLHHTPKTGEYMPVSFSRPMLRMHI
jgi:hypothetical protein